MLQSTASILPFLMVLCLLAMPSGKVERHTGQDRSAPMEQVSSDERAFYNLSFAAAAVHSREKIEEYALYLARHGVIAPSIRQEEDTAVWTFAEGLYLQMENSPIEKAGICLSFNGDTVSVPLEFDYLNEHQEVMMQYRDYAPADVSASDVLQAVRENWSDSIDWAHQNPDFRSSLFLALLQATSVCPGMSHDDCLEIIRDPMFGQGNGGSYGDILWYNTLTDSGMTSRLSLYFYQGKLCCAYLFISPSNFSYAIPKDDGRKNSYVAPEFMIDIENTWLVQVLSGREGV